MIDDYEGNYWKRSLLVTWKVLRPFVNRPTADDKYSLLSRDNLMKPIQMHFPEKQNNFFQFCCAFFKSTSNFEDFREKNDPNSLCISEIKDTKRRG